MDIFNFFFGIYCLFHLSVVMVVDWFVTNTKIWFSGEVHTYTGNFAHFLIGDGQMPSQATMERIA